MTIKLSNTQFNLLADGTQDIDKSGLITSPWICKNCAIPSSPPGQITDPADAGYRDTARMASLGNVYSLNRRAVRRNTLTTMKITITIILIQLLTICCKYSTQNTLTDEKTLDSQSEKINDGIAYNLINDFVLDSLCQTNLMAIEAMQFYNTKLDTNIIYKFGRFCSYNSTLFQELLKLNIIDTLDIGSISLKLSIKEHLEWDSTRLKIKTFGFYNLTF